MSDIRSQITGQVIECKTATFTNTDTGEVIPFGRLQIMQKDENGFFNITNVKIRQEQFGVVADVAALKGKTVTVEIEQRTYKDRTSYYYKEIPQMKKAA